MLPRWNRSISRPGVAMRTSTPFCSAFCWSPIETPPIKKLADRFLTNPKTIEVSRPASSNLLIDQRLLRVEPRRKKQVLEDRLRGHDVRTAIVFCNRKTTVRELFRDLKRAGLKAGEIHGDMEQPERIRELASSLKRSGFAVGQIQGDMEQAQRIAEFDRFKSGEINILVASDVAARGLDVKGVSHVINYDVPWQPDDYIHRIGRTGRAGMTGIAITLATPADAEQVAAIEKLTGFKITRSGTEPAAAPEAREPREARPPRDSRKPREARESRESRDSRPPRRERPAEAPEKAPPPPKAREERKPRPPRRDPQPQAEESDEGWNGPMPSFLSFRAD
jgi:superfamily II DNA/RNA helicase